MNKVNILDNNILLVSDYEEILDLIKTTINSGNKIVMHNVNAYILLMTKRNERLKNALSDFSHLFIDGIGTLTATKILYGKKFCKLRITGTDLYPYIFKLCSENKFKIFIWGGANEAAEIVKDKLSEKYPDIKEIVCFSREVNDFNYITSQINRLSPQILLVGTGSPEQEIWLGENHKSLNANIQLCVGSGIDYTAGTLKRAPMLFRKLALEWLFRLFQNPGRLWKRYLIDNIYFIFYILKQKFILNRKGTN